MGCLDIIFSRVVDGYHKLAGPGPIVTVIHKGPGDRAAW
jgi:hypothetical protein